MANSFGVLFRVTTFGESHGAGIGVVVDGCPSRVSIRLSKIQESLNRRRPGQSEITSPRSEPDSVQCLGGLEEELTLGGPLAFWVPNIDSRPGDYSNLAQVYRPSHADFTTQAKYGIRPRSGGGRASARETVARVIAGSVAEQWLKTHTPELEVLAFVESVADIRIPEGSLDLASVSRKTIDQTPVRCPDPTTAQRMFERIQAAKAQGDSVGGVVRALVRGVPAGLGEPVFGKFHASLAYAMLGLPAARGFEVGSGFGSTLLQGSENNDAWEIRGGAIRTRTNHSGGVQGGITNGEIVDFRVAFKPPSTLAQPQDSVSSDSRPVRIQASGRHDPCVLPRAAPIVEAMAWIVLADHTLLAARNMSR